MAKHTSFGVYVASFLFLMLPELVLLSLGILIPWRRQFLPEKSMMNGRVLVVTIRWEREIDVWVGDYE